MPFRHTICASLSKSERSDPKLAAEQHALRGCTGGVARSTPLNPTYPLTAIEYRTDALELYWVTE